MVLGLLWAFGDMFNIPRTALVLVLLHVLLPKLAEKSVVIHVPFFSKCNRGKNSRGTRRLVSFDVELYSFLGVIPFLHSPLQNAIPRGCRAFRLLNRWGNELCAIDLVTTPSVKKIHQHTTNFFFWALFSTPSLDALVLTYIPHDQSHPDSQCNGNKTGIF